MLDLQLLLPSPCLFPSPLQMRTTELIAMLMAQLVTVVQPSLSLAALPLPTGLCA